MCPNNSTTANSTPMHRRLVRHDRKACLGYRATAMIRNAEKHSLASVCCQKYASAIVFVPSVCILKHNDYDVKQREV